MIRTSSYKEFENLFECANTYSISWDKGKDANYHGKCYPDLAPKKTFWRKYKDNIGKIPEEENIRYYIQEYWNEVLSKLDVDKVYGELDYSTLLCYEKNNEFCHRHIVAAWFEILLGVKVPEVIVSAYKSIEVEKPEYIKEYLEDAMKANRNMHGFTSLRALYLFEKGEQLEREADELEEKTGKCYDHYRQAAAFLRSDADMEEDKYRDSHKTKKKIK